MEYLNITNARREIHRLVNTVAAGGNPIGLRTKHGNVILISEEELRGLEETAYLKSHPATYREILESINISLGECVEVEL
jgi:PHD/YefM family antitoxin component YafN of YafNO toxin-antitoxin module